MKKKEKNHIEKTMNKIIKSNEDLSFPDPLIIINSLCNPIESLLK